MFWDWFWEYGIVILFYVGVISLIYFNKSKFHFENKFIAMYKTKLGLKLMDKIGNKHPKTVKFLGTLGIYVGFLGMAFMVLFLLLGLYFLAFRPDLPPLISPVLPGIQIPGSPVKLPLVEGLIGLFAVVVIHEFSHGVMARAFNIPVKSSGFVMIGPLPGAFVEPDEKIVQKSPKKAQLSIFAAGPWSNILLFFIIFGLYALAVNGASNLYEPTGVMVVGFVDTADASDGGRLENIQKGIVVTGINGGDVNSIYDIKYLLQNSTPGDAISLTTDDGLKEIVLTNDPSNESIPYLGLMLDTQVEPIQGKYYGFLKGVQGIILEILDIMYWIFVLSLGIGIVNLLPIGPTDGGRMYFIALQKFFKKKKATNIYTKTSLILLVILIILIFVPIIKAIVGF